MHGSMKMDKGSTIVVTGGHGMVGKAIVAHLKAEGYDNVVPVGRQECDLTRLDDTIAFFNKARPDYVFHAAARVYGILGNMNNQGLSFLDNCLINTSVVEASRLVGVKKITVFGTGAVYPFPPTRLPLEETAIFDGRPHPSESAYAHAKRAMLAMLEAYQQSYGIDWAYIVSCNLFGPEDKFDIVGGHVVPSLIRKFFEAKREGGNVSVWGDGSAQRDFLYVKDAARVALLVMENFSGPVNMGSSEVWSIRQIAEAIADISGMTGRIAWDASKPNGQAYRAYDLSKLNSIGFKPVWSIQDGLTETWEWYCRNPTND